MEILKSDNVRHKELISNLKNAYGIYVFYDSQCKAVYVGKAKDQYLWKEMNSAFNRDRETIMYNVMHKTTGSTLGQDNRVLRKRKTYFKDIAHYFSAYEIDYEVINKIEALMIRSFTNSLFNVKMESIE